jgi:mono/diheme cytochrome c family protein
MSSSGRSHSAAAATPRARIRTWRWSTSAMGLVAAVGLVFAACGGGGNHTTKSTSSTSTSLAAQQQGAQIFEAKCASCHDARLAGQVTRDFPNVDDEIAVVTNGRVSPLETMPSFAGLLTTAQIRAVVEYTRVQLGK